MFCVGTTARENNKRCGGTKVRPDRGVEGEGERAHSSSTRKCRNAPWWVSKEPARHYCCKFVSTLTHSNGSSSHHTACTDAANKLAKIYPETKES